MTRVRASSTATQRNGASTSGRRQVARRPGQQRDQQTEQTVIEAQIAAEEKERQQRLRRTQAAVLAHGVEDPVTRSRVPQDSAHVAQQKTLPGRGRLQV